MSEKDFHIVCSTIDQEKEFLNRISEGIWQHPELGYEEFRAHATLTSALKEHGFEVHENYILPTAFKAEYFSRESGGPTVAVLLEYDALPGVGHACGHNLIAEAGLAAAIGIKAAMQADSTIRGKLLVLGAPAEENHGGKIELIKGGAFEGVKAAMMVHPTNFNCSAPKVLSRMSVAVNFKGQPAHAAAFPWQGRNALDAAVSAYTSIAMLRQQTKPGCRIHAILTKGGTVPNIKPSEARLELYVRAPTSQEMHDLFDRVKGCVECGARAAGCEVTFEEGSVYDNLITDGRIVEVYKRYAERFGLVDSDTDHPVGSTDMGNVSHLVPSIHPFYALATDAPNHSGAFTEAAGAPHAQPPTLSAAKAMAMTALALMRDDSDNDVEGSRKVEKALTKDQKKYRDDFETKVEEAKKNAVNVMDLCPPWARETMKRYDDYRF